MHVKLFREYIKQYGKTNLPFVIKRATENQTIYLSTNAEVTPMLTDEDVKLFLKNKSRNYSVVI